MKNVIVKVNNLEPTVKKEPRALQNIDRTDETIPTAYTCFQAAQAANWELHPVVYPVAHSLGGWYLRYAPKNVAFELFQIHYLQVAVLYYDGVKLRAPTYDFYEELTPPLANHPNYVVISESISLKEKYKEYVVQEKQPLPFKKWCVNLMPDSIFTNTVNNIRKQGCM